MIVERLPFVGAELERGVQWAERHNSREQEHCAKNDEDDPECAGHHAAKIQVGEQSGKHHTDDTIDIGKVAFHWKISFGIGFDVPIVGELQDLVCDKVT